MPVSVSVLLPFLISVPVPDIIVEALRLVLSLSTSTPLLTTPPATPTICKVPGAVWLYWLMPDETVVVVLLSVVVPL